MTKLGHWATYVKDTLTQSMDWLNLIRVVVGSCEHINDAFGWVGSGGWYSYWWVVVVVDDIVIGGWHTYW
jgi:hypothetical protein